MLLVFQNFGPKVTYISAKEKLPSIIRAGFGYYPTSRWTFSFETTAPRDFEPYFGLGAERWHYLSSNWLVAGRLGFSTEGLQGSLPGFGGLRLGFGLWRGSLGFDYAFVPMGQLGLAHRMSLALRL